MVTQTAVPDLLGGTAEQLIALDADQRGARDAILAGGNHVVLGAPGTGLTTTALETFVAWSADHPPESALLMVPTRQRAGRLRDELARRLDRTTGQVLVRTPASLAYAILRLRASHRGEPPPTLVSGPEQDTVLADLIAGHLGGEGVPITWPERIGPETLRLPAFRAELRDLLMRAAEAGLDGEGLDELGRRHDRPEWCAAGRLLAEYGDVMTLGELTPDRGARYDAATIVDQAVVALRTWASELSEETRPRWSLVLHDDYQDATLATARLLTALADDGARVSVLGDPDRGVQAFRGGQPALLDAATRAFGSVDGGLGAQVHVLGTSYRHGPRLREAVQRLTAMLPALGEERRRRAAPGAQEEPLPVEPVRHLLLPTAAQEVAGIALQLRIAHLHHGVRWSQMAVIVRTGARVGEIRRGLRTAGIPLAAATPDRPLREEPAVRPFLVALRCVIDDEIDTEAAAALLLSPLGGLDAVSMRSLRRVLRQRDGAGTPSDELLPRLFSSDRGDDALDDLPPRLHAAATSVAAVLDAGRAALAEDPRSTEMALWAMWDASGLAEEWQQRALAGGAAADRADADLDAVVSLFTAAEQFTDRTTGADPSTFLAHLATQDFAADTLAARGEDSETVVVHTAASAAGGEWDLVVVAGVQEDSWPDLRIRDTLLGAQQLADITTSRDTGLRRDDDAGMAEVLRSARAGVLADELRAFVAACSRARRALLLTAVLDTDARPSSFYEALLPPSTDGLGGTTGLPRLTSVTAALDLRGLVGELRAELHGPDERAAAALRVLEHLRQNGVEHADPARWPDRLAPTTSAPAHDPAQAVPISPSAVEKATSCPLHWALSTAGGRKPSSQAQNVGNLIHEIAAELPHGTHSELRAELARRWHEIGLDDAWVSRQERARAEEMVRRLSVYLADHPEPVDVEADFDVEIDVDGGRAQVRGRMDRVERTPEGLRVIDLKTGASPPTAEQTARHAQLGSYQLAVEHGAFGDAQPQGGSLVYLGTGARGPGLRHQNPLPADAEPGWAHELIAQTVRTLTSGEFPAQQNPMCGYCQVRTSCPVQPEGGRVVPRGREGQR